MQYRRYIFVFLLLSVATIFSVTFVANAQQATTCPALVSQALNQLGTNCASVGRNTSCYGFANVQHTAFASNVPADFYTKPGDHADLPITQAIQTGPLSLDAGQWGLNVMNVQANLPNALPGKGVVYLQMGGVEVENGVKPDAAVTLPETGITVNSTAATDLLSWPSPSVPGHASEKIVSIPSGSALSADALNPAGDFARVVFQNKAGWVSKSALDSSVDLSSLPAIGPDDKTPMQSFYYRTGIGGTPCAEAPSLLYIQAPNGVPTDITVLDQPVRIQSTIVLRTLPPGDQLGDRVELVVLSGLAILNADTPNEIIVPPGFSTTILLSDLFVSLGIEGDADEKAPVGTWSQPRPLTQDELDGLKVLEDLPNNVVNYPINIPIIIQASSVGGVIPVLIFPNQAALDEAKAACAAGKLSADICQYLGL